MSVWPALDTFCTIMSTLTDSSASVRNSRAAIAGAVRARAIVDLRLGDVVGDARDDGLLHRRVLLSDPRARLPREARPDVDGHVVVAGELDRAQRQDAPAGRGEVEHLLVRDAGSRRAVGTTRGSAVNTPATSV